MKNRAARFCHCLWLAGLAGMWGCNSQDADRLARVGRKAVARVAAIGGGTDDQLSTGWRAVRAGWDDATVDARVSARLRWDKDLAGTSIQVRAVGNAIELKGRVPNLAQRRRAVQLAETTTGVEKVVDALEMPARAP